MSIEACKQVLDFRDSKGQTYRLCNAKRRRFWWISGVRRAQGHPE